MRFEGKYIIVCGSTDGIGREIAIGFAREGANLILLARNETKIKNLLKSLITKHTISKHLYCVTDFSDSDYSYLEKIFSEVPKIDVLVTNTSGPDISNINTAVEAHLRYFQSSYMFFLRLIQLVLPKISSSENGRIINILGTTVLEPVDGFLVSNIKSAFANLSKSVSFELPPNVTINNVLPGPTNTKEFYRLISQISDKENLPIDIIKERIISRIPIKRLAEPEEIASLVLYLASIQAAFITGSNFKIDGGFTRAL
jgi:3-oxoacyl-[acyl-carrier protein] reductase